MRESIGAAWIFSLVLIFILMFTGFVAISINYARAFQLKNVVANLIEENEGVPTTSASLENAIEYYIEQNGYTAHDTVPKVMKADDPDGRNMNWTLTKCIKNGNPATASNDCTVAIYKADIPDYNYLNDKKYKNVFKTTDNPPSNGEPRIKRDYYKVITFFDFDLPVFRHILTFKVNGETQIIYDFAQCAGSGCGVQ